MIRLFLLFSVLHQALALTTVPVWAVNTLLNSGQHKAINGISTAPSTFNVSQIFNVAFSAAPRVVLSLEGYKQNAPTSGTPVGFKYAVGTITASQFTATVTVYGANMFFLFYNYMGVADPAYFTSYTFYTFPVTSNLVNITSTSRSETQILNNPAGQSFPNYLNNRIQSVVFLAGFKMNLGTTGTYINLTSRIESATTHSITIGTRGDAQVLEVCYFRIAFDKTAITQGYVSYLDSLYFEGANSTQFPTNTPVTPANFKYRNYLMGFNQISLSTTTQPTDIFLQIINSTQTIWTFSLLLGNTTNPTYQHLLANTFHHRRRVCGATTTYYNYVDELCYDVCPVKTYLASPYSYCEKCHYSCLTCSGGMLQTNCATCDSAAQNRSLNSSSCPCLPGFYDNGTAVCPACDPTCATCQNSADYCLTCNPSVHRRALAANNTCACQTGYYENSTNIVCLACDPTCATCQNSAAYCLTCNVSAHHRNLTANNTCACQNGYFETSAGSPVICSTCDVSCLTCAGSSGHCTSCNSSLHRAINSTTHTCNCIDGYFSSTPSTCSVCNSNCLTCSSSATQCLSCRNGQYLDIVNGRICQQCMTGCTTCTFNNTDQVQTCSICNTSSGFSLNAVNSSVSNCTCGILFYANAGACLACDYRCASCSDGASCSTCDLNSRHRQLNSNASAYCQCISKYYDDGSNPTCLPCNIRCLTCASSQPTKCRTCNTTTRALSIINNGTGSCNCKSGFQQPSTPAEHCIPVVANVCGNGLLQASEQCDDYNTEAGDGCSPACELEASHACKQFPNTTSYCYYNRSLNLAIDSVLKLLTANQITLGIKITAPDCNLQKLKNYLNGLTAIQVTSNSGRLLQSREMQAVPTTIFISWANFVITDAANHEGYLNLALDYTESISTLQNKQISFLSSNTQSSGLIYFYATPQSSLILEDPHNKIPITFHKPESYQAAIGLSYAFLIIIALNFLFFIVMVFLRKSVVPVENLLIFQFAYFGVAGQKQVELAISSLAYFGKFSLGVNINFIRSVVSSEYQSCVRMGKIYQQCNSLNNINITFYLAVLTFLFYLGCVGFRYKKQRDLNMRLGEQEASDQVSDATKQKQNMSEENEELESRSQTSSNRSNLVVEYQLPEKIKTVCDVCLEFTMGIFFLTAIEYLLTAINQGNVLKVPSIAWLAIVGVCFAGMWIVYFYSYPLSELSYVEMMKKRLEKFSTEKFAYFALFCFLLLWGLLLALAPGIAAYSLLIVWCLFWIYLTISKQIHRSRIHKLRSCINQIITFIIAILLIVLEYGTTDGLGLPQSICLLILLLASLVCNFGFYLYDRNLQIKMSTLSDDESQFKHAEDQFKDYSSRSSKDAENRNPPPQENDEIASNRKQPKLKLFQMSSPKRQALIESTEMKQTVRSKANELRSMKKQLQGLKIGRSNLADEKKVELSTMRKMHETKIEEQSEYKDL